MFWTVDTIVEEIKRVKDALNLERMPTYTEIADFYGDKRVASAVWRNGGRERFAKLLNIDTAKKATEPKKTEDLVKHNAILIYYVFCRRNAHEPWSEWGKSPDFRKALELEQFASEIELETQLVTDASEAYRLKRKAFAFFDN